MVGSQRSLQASQAGLVSAMAVMAVMAVVSLVSDVSECRLAASLQPFLAVTRRPTKNREHSNQSAPRLRALQDSLSAETLKQPQLRQLVNVRHSPGHFFTKKWPGAELANP